MTYPVNEIYAGLEGEGHCVGTPCVRVRFQGCSVTTCKLRKVCDQASAIPAKGGRVMTLEAIADSVRQQAARAQGRIQWVALSGGEPTDHHIEPLIWRLMEFGFQVRVETSGMVRRLEGPISYVRVSPKEPRPIRTRQDWGLELSVVWTGAEDLDAWEHFGNFPMRTLQPLWRADGTSNVQDCIRVCMERPVWQLSVQTHKWLGIP